jgi:hypothetical protein
MSKFIKLTMCSGAPGGARAVELGGARSGVLEKRQREDDGNYEGNRSSSVQPIFFFEPALYVVVLSKADMEMWCLRSE